MTYAFQTTDKLCFILDLMNGGDLHYHLSQHGTFFENEIRFYACEVILGLDHMHTRGIVYRDLKVVDSGMFVCLLIYCEGWLGGRVVSVLDSGAEEPGFKLQPQRCRVTVLGKLCTPIVRLFTKQQNW